MLFSLLAVGVPIIAFALLALTFSNAVIRDLKVSVVDADRTPTSLIYVQAIGSAPGVSVALVRQIRGKVEGIGAKPPRHGR